MKQLRIYVGTSVFGGCFDIEFQEESCAFFRMARDRVIKLLVSDITDKELSLAPSTVQEEYHSLKTEWIEPLVSSLESENLRNSYVEHGVVGLNQITDAHHVAIATIANADLIVSWNFKHLVHIEKIRGFNAVNLKEGYQLVEIRSPKEVV